MALAAHGFNINPGPVTWEERRQAVTHFLLKLVPKGPTFQVFAKKCPVLVKGFQGGYQFPEKAVDIEPSKLRPLKNAYSHPHDALQYLCHGVKSLVTTQRKVIPKAGYSITTEKRNRYGRS